jgi:hypothetical protein
MDNKKVSSYIKEDKDKMVSVFGNTRITITPKSIVAEKINVVRPVRSLN